MQILPVASGKGGVGKSLISTNLSIALAQAGKKVVLADLDLGASSIHLMLGTSVKSDGLGAFFSNPNIDFESLIQDTEYPNLRFLPGDGEIPGMANIKSSQKSKLIRKLRSIKADYLILDLGAGTSANTIDFFLCSGQGLIVTTPTLTATLNAYLFLKNLVFRIMHSAFGKHTSAWKYLERLRQDGVSLQKIYIPKLLDRIEHEDPEGYVLFQKKMKSFHPHLILNMLEDPRDGAKAGKIRRSCHEYLGVDIEHLGIVYRDHLQDIALSSRLPIIVYKPRSVLSQAIFRIADKLIQRDDEGESPLDMSRLDNSYKAAKLEAEIDFDLRMDEIQGLLHSGALTKGDLIDTIKTQQYEISSLKKENQLLKKKIVKAGKAGIKF